MAKTTIREEIWVKKPNENYEYAFKLDVDIIVDISRQMLTDEEYSTIRKNIANIRKTLSPYKTIAKDALKIAKKEETK